MKKNLQNSRNDKRNVSLLAALGIFLAFILLIF